MLTSQNKGGIFKEHYSYDAFVGCLAQLVEHRPYKARVGGSSPSASTIFLYVRVRKPFFGECIMEE